MSGIVNHIEWEILILGLRCIQSFTTYLWDQCCTCSVVCKLFYLSKKCTRSKSYANQNVCWGWMNTFWGVVFSTILLLLSLKSQILYMFTDCLTIINGETIHHWVNAMEESLGWPCYALILYHSQCTWVIL